MPKIWYSASKTKLDGFESSALCPRCSRLGLCYEPILGISDIDISCIYCGYRVSKVVVHRLERYKTGRNSQDNRAKPTTHFPDCR